MNPRNPIDHIGESVQIGHNKYIHIYTIMQDGNMQVKIYDKYTAGTARVRTMTVEDVAIMLNR